MPDTTNTKPSDPKPEEPQMPTLNSDSTQISSAPATLIPVDDPASKHDRSQQKGAQSPAGTEPGPRTDIAVPKSQTPPAPHDNSLDTNAAEAPSQEPASSTLLAAASKPSPPKPDSPQDTEMTGVDAHPVVAEANKTAGAVTAAPATIAVPAPVPAAGATVTPRAAPDIRPANLQPPDISHASSNSNSYSTSVFAPPPLMKPPDLQPGSNSFLAPPAGAPQGGLSMPMIGYPPNDNNNNNFAPNVLAHPNTAQRQSPLSMPQVPTQPLQPPTQANCSPGLPSTSAKPTPTPTPATLSTPATATPTPTTGNRRGPKPGLGQAKAAKAAKAGAGRKQQQPQQPQNTLVPSPPPSPPPNGKATRNCIILQNFKEGLIKEKSVQNRILFGKDMGKLAKPSAAPRCVITNHPARYKDPKTGLPYYDRGAFKKIRELERGEYKWSRLFGAWMGDGVSAAQGVPARFLDPNAPAPPKPVQEVKTEPQEGHQDASQKPLSSTTSAKGETNEGDQAKRVESCSSLPPQGPAPSTHHDQPPQFDNMKQSGSEAPPIIPNSTNPASKTGSTHPEPAPGPVPVTSSSESAPEPGPAPTTTPPVNPPAQPTTTSASAPGTTPSQLPMGD